MRWFVLACISAIGIAHADETANSPYISQLIKGQEDYVYVWTLGVEGLGDGPTSWSRSTSIRSRSATGKVSARSPPGPRRGAPHGIHRRAPLPVGGRPVRNRIWVFDVGRNPAGAEAGAHDQRSRGEIGFLGPHTYYALPADAGAGAVQHAGQGRPHRDGALQHKGEFITSYSMPAEGGGDGYGYDLAVNPKQNVLLTSSFTGYANYMRPLGELIKDAER